MFRCDCGSAGAEPPACGAWGPAPLPARKPLLAEGCVSPERQRGCADEFWPGVSPPLSDQSVLSSAPRDCAACSPGAFARSRFAGARAGFPFASSLPAWLWEPESPVRARAAAPGRPTPLTASLAAERRPRPGATPAPRRAPAPPAMRCCGATWRCAGAEAAAPRQPWRRPPSGHLPRIPCPAQPIPAFSQTCG